MSPEHDGTRTGPDPIAYLRQSGPVTDATRGLIGGARPPAPPRLNIVGGEGVGGFAPDSGTSGPGSAGTGGRRRRLLAFALAMAALAIVLVGQIAKGARPIGRAPARPVNVPITVRGWQGGPVGAQPIVYVHVGNGPALPVVLDTGSVGLNIFASAIRPSSVSPTGLSFSYAWGGGRVTYETQALSTLTIDGLTTTHPVKIGLIHKAGCLKSAPHCPPWGRMLQHAVGTLGIALSPSRVATNPLLSLPSPYSRSWSIALSGSAGSLELGAPLPSHSDASLSLDVLRDPTSAAPWATGLTLVCWKIRSALPGSCLPTLFDTGSAFTNIDTAIAVPFTRALPVGDSIVAWQPGTVGKPFWQFTSGSHPSDDAVLTTAGAPTFINTGIAAFFTFRITYDAVNQMIFLAPGQAPSSPPAQAWRQQATRLCVNITARRQATPQGLHRTSQAAELVSAEQLVNAGTLSLRLDDELAGLHVPTALIPSWSRALTSDQRASQMLLQFARSIPRYRTAASLQQAARTFGRRYMSAERGWIQVMEQLKIKDCF